MKMLVRIVVGIIGLFIVFFGVRQMMNGMHESSGKTPASQQLGETITSNENGYRHRIPKGWLNKPAPRAGVTMIAAPPESGLSSNMVTTVESFAGSLNDYVEANKRALQTAAPDAKVVSEIDFATEAKAIGHKVRLQNKMQGAEFAQTMYFFDGAGGRKIIVTCTAPQKVSEELAPLFDDCMRTFALSAR